MTLIIVSSCNFAAVTLQQYSIVLVFSSCIATVTCALVHVEGGLMSIRRDID